jgi:hypothetical protein
MIENTNLLEEIDRAYEAGAADVRHKLVAYLDGRIKGHYGCRGLLMSCEVCLVFRQVINVVEEGDK